MKTINFKRVILAGIAINFVSFLVGGGSYIIFKRVFEIEPTSVWKWTPAMGLNIPVSWWVLFSMNIVLAIVFAWVFAVLYKGIPGKGIQKGIIFGFFAWLIGVVPPMITLYLMTNIAPAALLYFSVQGLVEWLAYGITIAAIYKERGSETNLV